MDPTESSEGISPGIIAAIVVVLVIIAVVIGVLVFFVQRYYALQSRIQQSFQNYPSMNNNSTQGERRGSAQSQRSAHSHGESCVEGSNSDLPSYHSDVEGYPVSSGRYSSNRESINSELSGGIDNMAYSIGSKGSVTSSSSNTPSVMYVSTISVKGAKKLDEDGLSVKERVHIINSKSQQDLVNEECKNRKISSNSDDGPQTYRHSSDITNGVPDLCNATLPHHRDDELTVTTIGIRDRTSSEVTISTIRAQFLREKLEEKKRVKSQDDVNIKPASHITNIAPFQRARFTVGNPQYNRDSVVTISTVSSKDRSMSDVTISTLSKNSVYMGSSVQIGNGGGEVNHAFQTDSVTDENRFSNMTLSTVLSGDQNSAQSEDENDCVFVNNEDPLNKAFAASNTGDVGTKESNVNSMERRISSQETPVTNGITQAQGKMDPKSGTEPCNLNRSGSVQSKTSEISCSHNHESHHRKKNVSANLNGVTPRPRNASSSSESSLSSNGCSECDSCPYCRDCASVISDEIPDTTNNNISGKFVSIVKTS